MASDNQHNGLQNCLSGTNSLACSRGIKRFEEMVPVNEATAVGTRTIRRSDWMAGK
jgi:hypothetical protein